MNVTNPEAQIAKLRQDIAHLETCRAALSERAKLEEAFRALGEPTVGVAGSSEQLSTIEAELTKNRFQLDALLLLKEYRGYELAANNIEAAEVQRERLQAEMDADQEALAHHRYHVLGMRDQVRTGMGSDVDFWRNESHCAPSSEVSSVRLAAMTSLHAQHQAAFPSSDIMIVNMRGSEHPEFPKIYSARKAAQ